MSKLFEYKASDKAYYEKNIRDFMPQEIIDVHTHIWLKSQFHETNTAPARTAAWPMMVASENTAEDLAKTYRLLFPDKKVTPLVFTHVAEEFDIESGNEYAKQSAKDYGYPSLMVARPSLTAVEFEKAVEEGGFIGCKVYLTLAERYIPEKEIRIYDFIPPHLLEVINRRCWILMLHIPRDARLKDPVNLAQMVEIDTRYPDAQVIIAHVGRAYCSQDTQGAFEILSKTKNLLFDISANSNSGVFSGLIRTVGPERIMFGSDLPILRMRARRICENGKYINIVPKGLYGDVSADSHMREATGEEADKLTFFMYEEIQALHEAAEECGLNTAQVTGIFHGNAKKMILKAGGRI